MSLFDIVVVTGLGDDRRVKSRATRVEPNTLPISTLSHVASGAYAKVLRATRTGGQWLVPNGNVTYIKIEEEKRGVKYNKRGFIDVTKKIKGESQYVRQEAWHFLKREFAFKLPVDQKKRRTGLWFGNNGMKGYIHWYSDLDGVSRPCVNGFRMMANLDTLVAVEMLHNACKLAREYIKFFAPFTYKKGATLNELVLAVAFRFLSGPYGEETGNDDRSLWGVMSDRAQKDCDDLTMIACAVFYAVTQAINLEWETYDSAVTYLRRTFARALFVQGEATPNVAQCASGGHVFMVLTRTAFDQPNTAMTSKSFRNGLLVECTTPMMPPNVEHSQPESDDGTTFVCGLKNYNLNKYTSIVALYTPYDTYFVKTEQDFGVSASVLLGKEDSKVYIHRNSQFKVSSELIASGQSNFLYEYYDGVFVKQLRTLMGLGTHPASEGGNFRSAAWGCPPHTASECFSVDVGGGTWCIFRPADRTQKVDFYYI